MLRNASAEAGRNCVFAYGRRRDGAPGPYSALAEALKTIVGTMEATGSAERAQWRPDVIGGMPGLVGFLEDIVPELAKAFGDQPQAADVMPRILEVGCTAPPSPRLYKIHPSNAVREQLVTHRARRSRYAATC
jgi:hypothetical protein